MILLWVAVAMAARDALATMMVVAEARGRPLLAGTLDAAGDAAGVASTVFGAGEIVLHGWNGEACLILAVMMGTSFAATALTVRYGRRLTAAPA